MLLYLDSSAIVRLYVNEQGSDLTRVIFSTADGAATSLVAYAEVQAAFARLRRTEQISRAVLERISSNFDDGWPAFYAIEVNEELVKSAGSLTGRHALSGFDAIHLASALAFRSTAIDQVNFAVADNRLRQAALSEGFVVV